ncbi:MAG: hypothetical protein M5U14_17230 [Acidimicrobiia bacterium]|nr:hypothetical protein [Acidimicrobiia bacterium]
MHQPRFPQRSPTALGTGSQLTPAARQAAANAPSRLETTFHSSPGPPVHWSWATSICSSARS